MIAVISSLNHTDFWIQILWLFYYALLIKNLKSAFAGYLFAITEA
jgi:hypothetical protein